VSDETTDQDLLAPRARASADQTHAQIEALLRAEILDLRARIDALEAARDSGSHLEGTALAALRHRHAVEVTLAHMRQIVWYAGHSTSLPTLDQMKGILAASEYFDPDWYLAQDPGLRSSGMDPAEHYLRAGSYEGRNPGPGFDTMAYYLANPDVAAASWPALPHYESAGRAEGRPITLTGESD